jgi:4-carboxymuconolactone decarboxylase
MLPNEHARKNHDELFPGHVSTLAVTDPELIETFDNFACRNTLALKNRFQFRAVSLQPHHRC